MEDGNENLQEELNKAKDIISAMKDERKKLNDEITRLNDHVMMYVDNLLLINKIVADKDVTIKDKNCEIKLMEEELEKSKLEIKDLKSRNKTTYANATKINKKEGVRSRTEQTSVRLNKTDSGICNVSNSLDNVTNSLDNALIEKIEHIIDKKLTVKSEKLNEFQGSEQSFEKSLDEMYDRNKNIIIHGLYDVNNVNEDEKKVNFLLKTIGVKTKPVSICRLGNTSSERVRPIMVRVESTLIKAKIMKSLWRLKYVRDNVKVSVTNDYSADERKEIRKWVDEAKRRNERTNDGIKWKIRGNPTTGICLIKTITG